MINERRVDVRYVVDGLCVAVDGQFTHILDIAASSVRLLRDREQAAPKPTVRLRFTSEPGFPMVDIACNGALVRQTAYDVVYAYESSEPAWRERLAQFDTFQDLCLLELER